MFQTFIFYLKKQLILIFWGAEHNFEVSFSICHALQVGLTSVPASYPLYNPESVMVLFRPLVLQKGANNHITWLLGTN